MRLNTATRTFLFTDIEGSTKLWEAYPDAMQLGLARHDALLRAAIEQHHGTVFKTMGDAFCAVFLTAQNAVAAALASQLALREEPWPEPIQINVRMALHTGAVESRDEDYFGLPLNRVSRLLSIAHGGQVVVSLATQSLIGDSLPESVSLLDRGNHKLRDLQQAEHVFQLCHPKLIADFPALRSLCCARRAFSR
jgi:class 3 adenylate cyclase